MSRNNVINNATGTFTIDPGSAADVELLVTSGSTNFILGTDHSASDGFVISIGTALGTSDSMTLATNGTTQFPLTPCFFVRSSTTQSNVTGDGTVVSPVPFGTSIIDQQSNFNTGTGYFTASVTGKYLLGTCLYLSGIPTPTRGTARIVTSNRSYVLYDMNFTNTQASNSIMRDSNVVLADLDSGDTASVYVMEDGSTKTADITNSGYATIFYGYLAS